MTSTDTSLPAMHESGGSGARDARRLTPTPDSPALPVPFRCRLCGREGLESFVDLGATPPCERFLSAEQLHQPETAYPLRALVCPGCLLVQLQALITPEDTFTEYAYFASFSDSWVAHAGRFVTEAVDRLGLDDGGYVVEVASNDGYLLNHVMRRGIRCLGIEPSVNVGEAARAAGVPTHTAFLSESTGRALRERHGPADLVVANNVYAHVPDVTDFTKGLRALVADEGWVSIEVQHLRTLMRHNQYDTIYHEHFQYYTALTAARALASGGLTLVDAERLPTHGGSLRLWARPEGIAGGASPRLARVLAEEESAGLHALEGHRGFASAVARIRRDLLRFLLDAAAAGNTVVGYGAPGKGNTLLNHCGIRPDLLAYTVDRNPYKHGRFTPGARIPIHPVERIAADRPDYVLVLPWNLRGELVEQLRYVGDWGGRLVFPIPELEIVEVSR